MRFHDNLKFLRRKKGFSQQRLADILGIGRPALNSYERNTQPNMELLIKMADHFNVSVDALLRYDLSSMGDFQLSQMFKGLDFDITGKKLRMLMLTSDQSGNENIEMVSQKAHAGYTNGFEDPDFISTLPKFYLPFLAQNKSYRCFQLAGDSMLPIEDGSWVTASYLQNWEEIVDGQRYILVSKNDGIVFKMIYKKIEEEASLLLVSSNPIYKPYRLHLKEIQEIWKFETVNSF